MDKIERIYVAEEFGWGIGGYEIVCLDDGFTDFSYRSPILDGSCRDSWTLSKKKMASIVRYIKEVDFFSLDDDYSVHDIEDFPSWTITVVMSDGRSKTVHHYEGDASAPLTLINFEQQLKKILGVEKKIKAFSREFLLR
jgi:hypothetical protein